MQTENVDPAPSTNPEIVQGEVVVDQQHNNNNQQDEGEGDVPLEEHHHHASNDNNNNNNHINRKDRSEDELTPPTRRLLLFAFICIVAFGLLIAGIFEPIFEPNGDSNLASASTLFTLWKSCSRDSTGRDRNCTSVTSDSTLNSPQCSKMKGTLLAIRAFQIIATVASLLGACCATAGFLGSKTVANNQTLFLLIASIGTFIVSLVAFSLEINFNVSASLCDDWSEGLVELTAANGEKYYKHGAIIPLTVVGCILMLVSLVVALVKSEWLDKIVETKDN